MRVEGRGVRAGSGLGLLTPERAEGHVHMRLAVEAVEQLALKEGQNDQSTCGEATSTLPESIPFISFGRSSPPWNPNVCAAQSQCISISLIQNRNVAYLNLCTLSTATVLLNHSYSGVLKGAFHLDQRHERKGNDENSRQ